jgi:uncharacterized coiled-coil protein SlyX
MSITFGIIVTLAIITIALLTRIKRLEQRLFDHQVGQEAHLGDMTAYANMIATKLDCEESNRIYLNNNMFRLIAERAERPINQLEAKLHKLNKFIQTAAINATEQRKEIEGVKDSINNLINRMNITELAFDDEVEDLYEEVKKTNKTVDDNFIDQTFKNATLDWKIKNLTSENKSQWNGIHLLYDYLKKEEWYRKNLLTYTMAKYQETSNLISDTRGEARKTNSDLTVAKIAIKVMKQFMAEKNTEHWNRLNALDKIAGRHDYVLKIVTKANVDKDKELLLVHKRISAHQDGWDENDYGYTTTANDHYDSAKARHQKLRELINGIAESVEP